MDPVVYLDDIIYMANFAKKVWLEEEVSKMGLNQAGYIMAQDIKFSAESLMAFFAAKENRDLVE